MSDLEDMLNSLVGHALFSLGARFSSISFFPGSKDSGFSVCICFWC